jgi:hypothetical protein
MIVVLSYVRRYLYTLVVSLDGNFKLKRKSQNINDPELSEGWSYFVDEKSFQAFLATLPETQEVSLPL